MPFERRILHHGSSPTGAPQLLSLRAVRNCWFDLHRQGGCGPAEIELSDRFELRDDIEIGDWISFEAQVGERWYLGRVEERESRSPAGARLRLAGMGIELNEIFPGGFGEDADGQKPHRYADTDLFTFDPDRSLETFDSAGQADDIIRLLLTQYASDAHFSYVPELVETPLRPAPVSSLKVRGEESLRVLIKELATRAQGASWGVDASGQFFFLQPREAELATFRIGRDLTRLSESRDREYLFNRILLTGDYVYDHRDESLEIARRSFRWRGNYVEPLSRQQHGERRIRLWIPWIRTQPDAMTFAREFFRTYAQPTRFYAIETSPQTALPVPWLGRVRLEDQNGDVLLTSQVATVRVLFDHAPRFLMELGPEDPHDLWPEPPQDERWELPDGLPQAGGILSLTDFSDGLTGHPSGGSLGGTESGPGSSLNSLSSSSLNSDASDDSAASETSSGVSYPPSGSSDSSGSSDASLSDSLSLGSESASTSASEASSLSDSLSSGESSSAGSELDSSSDAGVSDSFSSDASSAGDSLSSDESGSRTSASELSSDSDGSLFSDESSATAVSQTSSLESDDSAGASSGFDSLISDDSGLGSGSPSGGGSARSGGGSLSGGSLDSDASNAESASESIDPPQPSSGGSHT